MTYDEYPTPTESFPGWTQIKYDFEVDSGCLATDGCWVEPDGECEHEYPSWMLYLGVI
jgi:hypothetical protein